VDRRPPLHKNSPPVQPFGDRACPASALLISLRRHWCYAVYLQISMVDGRVLTFGEVISLSYRLADGLTAAGFKLRDRLLVACHNVVEYASLFLAVARCRGHLTTISPSATEGLLNMRPFQSLGAALSVAPCPSVCLSVRQYCASIFAK